MIKPSFFPFLIRVVVVFVVAILPAYYFERVRSRYRQTLLHYKEEIGRLYEIIQKEKRTVQRLENENRLLLGPINQVPIAQCKNHPLLKRLYDKDFVSRAFSDAKWKEFMLAFESIYPYFATRLQKPYPDKSIRNVRISSIYEELHKRRKDKNCFIYPAIVLKQGACNVSCLSSAERATFYLGLHHTYHGEIDFTPYMRLGGCDGGCNRFRIEYQYKGMPYNVCPIDDNGLIGYLDTIYGRQKKEVDYVEP